MSSYYKIPKEYYIYDKASDFGKVISTYLVYRILEDYTQFMFCKNER